MANRPGEFSHTTQQQALTRQKNRCGSCGTPIAFLGQAGKSTHKFGEGAQAHHIRHIKLGGTEALDNCVILCQSCHYSAHEGGNYRLGMIPGHKGDFGYYNG